VRSRPNTIRWEIWRRRLVAISALITAGIVVLIVLNNTLGEDVDQRGAQVTHVLIDSRAVGEQLRTSVVVPRGANHGRRRPMLVFLHGRGADEQAFLDTAMFTALRRLGRKAPIVAFPDGGDHSYWHDRADGAWGRYVADEVIPRVVRRFNVDRNRVAIGGISMGGFGAYDLARLHPGRFCAVGGHSPALWASADQTAEGAFDDAADFASHDVIAAAHTQPAPFTSQPMWLDAGVDDPFREGDEAFASALRATGAPLIVKTWPGGHEDAYWDSHWGAYLRFYADALADCRR
jgi:S-formylglutathione hydrolase FrmB